MVRACNCNATFHVGVKLKLTFYEILPSAHIIYFIFTVVIYTRVSVKHSFTTNLYLIIVLYGPLNFVK